MRSLLDLEVFANLSPTLISAAKALGTCEQLILQAEASLLGILSLSQLEAATLDSGISYRRRLVLPGTDNPGLRDAIVIMNEGVTEWDEENNVLKISPTSVGLSMGQKPRERIGVLDSVSQAAAVAAILAVGGKRVGQLRAWACSGQWLRDTLDQVYDPVWTSLRDHLMTEGSIRILPLPEVEVITEMDLPGLSHRSLVRLCKAWPTLDHQQRSSALSELMLPVINASEISAPRLEGLGWGRIMAGNWSQDLFTQLNSERVAWEGESEPLLYASRRIDHLIATGSLF